MENYFSNSILINIATFPLAYQQPLPKLKGPDIGVIMREQVSSRQVCS
jgi:hypothetical protein